MHNHYTGTIARWVDGDTVVIDAEATGTFQMEAFGSVHIINHHITKRDTYRLIIVDTPERGQLGYREAIEFVNAALPPGTRVELYTHGVDDGGFGRTLADVLIPGADGATISSLLLQEGKAEPWVKK